MDLPNEIELELDQPRKAASLICEYMEIDTVRIIADDRMMIVTRQPQSLCDFLHRLVNEQGLKIRQIHTRDESLQDLFTTLMRRHRGEL